MDWIRSTASKVSGLVDKAQGFAAETVVMVAEPKVHEEIDTRVTVFREAALQALPQQCEDRLKGKAEGGSPVAWVFHRVLGDNTDVLVNMLLEKFRPGITNATAGLSDSATQKIMAQLKDLLDGAEAEAGGSEAAAAAPAGVSVEQQIEQLQVSGEAAPEQQSRGIQLHGQEAASAAEDGSSFRSKALSHLGMFAGMAFSVESRLPDFEEAARQLVHPLFDALKTQVWELVPEALQDVLGTLVGEKKDEVEANPEEAGVAGDEAAAPAGASRGLGSWIQSKLEGKAGVLLDKVMAAALDALGGPLQTVIGQLVDELESTSTQAAFAQIRQKLAEYKLISSA